MIVDVAIVALKAFLVLFMVLNLAGFLGWSIHPDFLARVLS